MKRNDTLNELKNRILEISYKNKLSHLGSCLTALPIIYNIYNNLQIQDRFILSSGHAGLALYVVLEHFWLIEDAEELFNVCGVHPNADECGAIDASTGSLGCGLPIAIGIALALPESKVHCLISDGELYEGSIWESLIYLQENKLTNLFIHVNFNSYSATRKLNFKQHNNRLRSFKLGKHLKIYRTNVEQYDFLNGQEAHYKIIGKEEYETVFCQDIN